MNISERIKLLRDQEGISQANLAKLIGVSAGNVGEWEKGRSKPGADALIALSKHFKVTTDWLLTGNGNKDTQILVQNTNAISDEDIVVIKKFLQLTERQKGRIEVAIEDLLTKRTTSSNSTNGGEEAATSETA